MNLTTMAADQRPLPSWWVMAARNVLAWCHRCRMTSWLGYESVYSFQETAFGHWCRIEAILLAQQVTMRRQMGGGAEWLVEARHRAREKFLSKHEVRQWLVGAASADGREIISYGYDDDGLVASVVFYPARALAYEPIWVSREDTDAFTELLAILQRSDLPFESKDLASPQAVTDSHVL